MGQTEEIEMHFSNMMFNELTKSPLSWLVTGAAGFIGSNLVETLLRLDQRVVGLDNFSTGKVENLKEIESALPLEQFARFKFLNGDIRNPEICREAARGVNVVTHQAALGSVPRSIQNPSQTHDVNVTGFLNVLMGARDNGVRRVVYASSSSVYGDLVALPQVEEGIGKPLSPYAASKLTNEVYAGVFGRCFGLECVGLRYFNVFGPRQDPNGEYAAVIPRWIKAMIRGEPTIIFGDGSTSRDFCYVANVVQANILAATSANPEVANQVFNIALGRRTTLNDLHEAIRKNLLPSHPELAGKCPTYQSFRRGDIQHSQARIDLARDRLGFKPTHQVGEGLEAAMQWYQNHS